jgi:glycosyltransferase involved in cell wall biosynthesis
MTIAFIHQQKAFLPELVAYQQFFAAIRLPTMVIRPEDISKNKPDVEWHFMGTDMKKTTGAVKIHEYASASVPPFQKGKNKAKKLLNVKPDYRLFLNPYVKDKMNFMDHIPFGYRDMGISDFFLTPVESKKQFDFIYVGNIDRTREIENLFTCFADGTMKAHSLLILSDHYQTIRRRFEGFKNIIFAGPVAHEEVKSFIAASRFAINYVPDKEPYREQTSTKFLEYAALNIPVITADYPWIRNFQARYGGKYYYLRGDLSNFEWEGITGFDFAFPELGSWSWETQIRNSGVLEFLKEKFPGSSL